MTFKDAVKRDIAIAFLNEDEFAERYTVVYDGEMYTDVLAIVEGPDEQERQAVSSGGGIAGSRTDSARGLYQVSAVLHCAVSDLGGKQPEKGQKIKLNGPEDGRFFTPYYVAASHDEMGMLRVELEAIDE